WQVTLVQLPRCQFVLMSATLANVTGFVEEITERTGREVTIIDDVLRPVPLDFRWSLEPLPEAIRTILEDRDAPVDIVHFNHKDTVEQAEALQGHKIIGPEEKERIREIIGDFRFSKGFGLSLSRLVREVTGVTLAGTRTKYGGPVGKLPLPGLLRLTCRPASL